MKKFFATLGLSLLLVVPSISTAVAVAESTSTDNNTASSSDDSATLTETEKTEMNARVEKQKAEFKVKLATAEKLKIELKCSAAQGLIGSVKGRIKGIETSRGEVYKNVVDHLTDLSAKLKAKNVDTTALDADIAVLKTKIATFNTDLAAYKQSVTDLVAISCKQDPAGFKAALLAARANLDKVKKDAEDVRAYVTGTIKPLLVQIRSQVEKDDSSTSNQGSTN